MPSDSVPDLDAQDAEWILGKLRPLLGSGEAVLVGGQALLAWASALAVPIGLETTIDIDLLGGRDVVLSAATLLDGKARLATIDDHTPHAGIVLFRDRRGHERQLDVLHDLFGATASEVRASAVTVGATLLLHPFTALKDKTAQLGTLRTDEHTIRQAKAAVALTRALAIVALDRDEESHAVRRRQALRTNTAVYGLALTRPGIRAKCDYGVDVLAALVHDHPLLSARTREIDIPRRRERVAANRLAYARRIPR